jgi:hypothetical protein
MEEVNQKFALTLRVVLVGTRLRCGRETMDDPVYQK